MLTAITEGQGVPAHRAWSPLRWLAVTVTIALAYALAAWLALTLAIPPGFSSAVWPPAGIALAAMLLWGSRTLPGVYLGSLVVNAWQLAENGASVPVATLVAAAIAVAGAAHACLGAWLIRRWVGFPTALNHERDVAAFFGLGGPVACVVSATVGHVALVSGGLVPWADVPFSWWTWWVGDSIGVLVFTPLVLIAFSAPGTLWRSRWRTVAVPLGIMFVVVVSVFWLVRDRERERTREQLAQLAERGAHQIELRLNANLETLQGIAGVIRASGAPDQQTFRAITADALARNSSLHGISWNRLVRAADRASFEAAQRRAGYRDFRIVEVDSTGQFVPAGRREEYLPITHRATLAVSRAPLGFDVASEPIRLEALRRARATGSATLSARVELFRSADLEHGVLAFIPVYRRGPVSAKDGRPEQLEGYITGGIRLRAFVSAALRDVAAPGTVLRLEDVGSEPGERLLETLATSADGVDRPVGDQASPASSRASVTHDFTIGGRRWRLTVQPVDGKADGRSWQAWLLLAGGLLFTGLLGAFLLAVTGRSSLVSALVDQRTAALNAANAAIESALAEKTVLLNEVHHRVKNNLQVVVGLLRLQSGQTDNTIVRAVLDDSERRVQSMALIHQLFYEGASVARVNLGEYLQRLVALLASSHHLDPHRVRLECRLDDVELDLKQALPCGLLANEALSNAFKYAFPDGRAGAIRVELSRERGRDTVALAISDDGVGLPEHVDPRTTKTLGMTLIVNLAEQAGGTLQIEREGGTRVAVRLPLADAA